MTGELGSSGDKHAAFLEQAATNFDALGPETFQDSLIIVGLNRENTSVIQIIAMVGKSVIDARHKRLELVRHDDFDSRVNLVSAGDENHSRVSFPLMRRFASRSTKGWVWNDVVSTSDNLDKIDDSLGIVRLIRGNAAEGRASMDFSELRGPLEPEKDMWHTPRATAITKTTKDGTNLFGFAALRHTIRPLSRPDIKKGQRGWKRANIPTANPLTERPTLVQSFDDLIVPGVGIAITNKPYADIFSKPFREIITLLPVQGSLQRLAEAYWDKMSPDTRIGIAVKSVPRNRTLDAEIIIWPPESEE